MASKCWVRVCVGWGGACSQFRHCVVLVLVSTADLVKHHTAAHKRHELRPMEAMHSHPSKGLGATIKRSKSPSKRLSPDSITATAADYQPVPFELDKAFLDNDDKEVNQDAYLKLFLISMAIPVVAAVLLAAEPWMVVTLPQAIATTVERLQANPLTLVGVGIAGFAAQLVDGALGMGYGLTSSTVLVSVGLSPRVASEVVHLAQLGTTLASGLAHYREGTVDWPTTWRIALPGVVGALIGASLISTLPISTAKAVASGLLLMVGLYLLKRFYHPNTIKPDRYAKPDALLLAPIGLLGGFVDVTGGGGWGPVATSGLLAEGRLLPSKVIGTVSLSEFFVTVAAVVGFCCFPAASEAAPTAAATAVRLDLMAVLLLGGLLAAPIAPKLISKVQPQLLGVTVGGFICFTNARSLLKAASASSTACSATLTAWSAMWAFAIFRVATRKQEEKQH